MICQKIVPGQTAPLGPGLTMYLNTGGGVVHYKIFDMKSWSDKTIFRIMRLTLLVRYTGESLSRSM